MADLASVGHNNPPSQIESLTETCNAVGDWLKTNPVVQTEEEARAAKPHVDRLRLGLQDMKAEEKSRTKPLLDQVTSIRAEYDAVETLTEKLLNEAKNRISAWVKEEEERRRKFAEEARQKTEELEFLAREAEERERKRRYAERMARRQAEARAREQRQPQPRERQDVPVMAFGGDSSPRSGGGFFGN